MSSRDKQLKENKKLISVEETAPIWIANESNCQICHKEFTLLFRRHHCRNCGKCVCEICSRDKVRILRIDANKLFKVCNPCAVEIKDSRTYGF